MADIAKLKAGLEKAEKDAQALMREKDKLQTRLRKATDKAAKAQKTYADAVAAQAIVDRDDLDDDGKQALAANLGLRLP